MISAKNYNKSKHFPQNFRHPKQEPGAGAGGSVVVCPVTQAQTRCIESITAAQVTGCKSPERAPTAVTSLR